MAIRTAQLTGRLPSLARNDWQWMVFATLLALMTGIASATLPLAAFAIVLLLLLVGAASLSLINVERGVTLLLVGGATLLGKGWANLGIPGAVPLPITELLFIPLRGSLCWCGVRASSQGCSYHWCCSPCWWQAVWRSTIPCGASMRSGIPPPQSKRSFYWWATGPSRGTVSITGFPGAGTWQLQCWSTAPSIPFSATSRLPTLGYNGRPMALREETVPISSDSAPLEAEFPYRGRVSLYLTHGSGAPAKPTAGDICRISATSGDGS